MLLAEYLSKYFPYQAEWSSHFAAGGHSPRTIALRGGEAEAEARRLLAEAISPTSYDFSLLKELPLKVYVLPPEGPEYVLKQGGYPGGAGGAGRPRLRGGPGRAGDGCDPCGLLGSCQEEV